MYITREEKENIIRELIHETNGKLDGSRKNILVPVCPFCGKEGYKFGIYIGEDSGKRKMFMSNCFKCQSKTNSLDDLLSLFGRDDLKITEKASFDLLDVPDFLSIKQDEIDDELCIVDMPEGWKRCFKNPYLKSREFTLDDYEYFPVGTTRGLNFKFDNYVVFPIIDAGDIVGYVSRHVWPKEQIDKYNERARWAGKYEIRRYNNSKANDFVKLLYNYDSVQEDKTDTVIIVEGIFDVIAITRKLDLYDNKNIAAVATFGKKISQAQILKLQNKGVRTVIVAYDADAREASIKAAEVLTDYFDCYIANMGHSGKDFDEMDFWEIYDIISDGLMTVREYKLKTV